MAYIERSGKRAQVNLWLQIDAGVSPSSRFILSNYEGSEVILHLSPAEMMVIASELKKDWRFK